VAQAAEARLTALVNAPLSRVAAAAQIIDECRAVAAANEKLAEQGARKVYQWLRNIVTPARVSECFSYRGANLNSADEGCNRAIGAIGAMAERCQIGTASRPHAWDEAITSLLRAGEYLEILNRELSPDASPLVRQVHEHSIKMLKIYAGVAVALVAAPVVYVFAAEAAALGLAGLRVAAMTTTGARVLTLVIANPIAALEITNVIVGTTISIGMAGGPVPWLRGLTTLEGAAQTGTDLVAIYIALHTGSSMPRPGQRASPDAPNTRTVRMTGRVEHITDDRIDIRVLSVDEVQELPPIAPPQARHAHHIIPVRPRVEPAGEQPSLAGLPPEQARAALDKINEIRRKDLVKVYGCEQGTEDVMKAATGRDGGGQTLEHNSASRIAGWDHTMSKIGNEYIDTSPGGWRQYFKDFPEREEALRKAFPHLRLPERLKNGAVLTEAEHRRYMGDRPVPPGLRGRGINNDPIDPRQPKPPRPGGHRESPL
jgi:hypothetical protein